MKKKPKIKYEESTLNFRVSNDLKLLIGKKAQEMNITASKYLRQVLEDVHDGTLERRVEIITEKQTFLSSNEFLRLVFWIYQKKADNKLIESGEQLAGHVRTLKRLDGHLPEEIVSEFDKVLTNIITIKKDSKYNTERFDFPDPYGRGNQFDYGKVECYFLNHGTEN